MARAACLAPLRAARATTAASHATERRAWHGPALRGGGSCSSQPGIPPACTPPSETAADSLVHAVIFDGDGPGTIGGAGGRARPGAFDSAGGPTDLGEGAGPDTGPTRGDANPDSGVGSKR